MGNVKMNNNGKGDFKGTAMGAYAVYGAAGIQLAASVVAGLVFGNFLDKKLSTGPWLAVAGITLGFIGGIVNLVRILGWFNRKREL